MSTNCSDDQWSGLKNELKVPGSQLILPCCNQPGLLRINSKGLKHFVHLKSDSKCGLKSETAEQLRSKVEIVKACQASGWNAIPEYSEMDWKADVMAVKNGVRVAFEVHWKKQTMEELMLMNQRYKESNVRGCWLFRTPPKPLRVGPSILADKDMPSFRVKKDESGNVEVDLSGRGFSLSDFIAHLLKGKIKYCGNYRLLPRQEVAIVVFETSCWKCKRSQHLYTVDQHLKTICNQDMYIMGSMWDSDDIDKSPAIVATVKELMSSEKDIVIGELKKRFSKTIQHTYLSHGCYYCDAIFGDFYLTTEKMQGLDDPNRRIFKKTLNLGEIKQEGPHWCYSEANEFCE